MCGIIGYAGHRPAVPVIIEGLKRMEYRGYDSAGVAFAQQNELQVIRAEGKLGELENRLNGHDVFHATTAIGHTRWATHGLPVERNAHPHCDSSGCLALVHNGIIENYQSLREMLKSKGRTFLSDTDSEVLVQLIAELRTPGTSLRQAFSQALSRVEGTYAVALIDLDEPNRIWAARKSSPLLLGVGVGENFVASDIPAFLGYTRDVVFLEDNELVELDPFAWQVFNASTLEPLEKKVNHITWDFQSAQKGGYRHFMLKEIFEQPTVITNCLAGRLDLKNRTVSLPELDALEIPEQIQIVACGTSYHAGLWGQHLLESWAQIPVRVEIASEFRYRNPIFKSEDMILAISQSGETADTLASMRLAKEHGVKVLGLCNVVGSSVAREADTTILTQAGPEISVASTKAMCSQLILLTLLALYWGRRKQTLPANVESSIITGLLDLPQILEAELPLLRSRAQELAPAYSTARSFFYLGRGMSFPLALEGALKLKEISYIHAEGYAAGEMKHGPIALIEPEFPTFALALNDALLPKTVSNLVEVQARNGKVIALCHSGFDLEVDHTWEIPNAQGPLSTFLALPALQLFAYEMAVYLGKDVDQPRNLAKSVTVE
ncbi:glucosamine--fructose-6-phosphate aminotransferase (isomerizing) [Desulfonatronum thiosulfatophilum]|uniref:Glutamine--fructose-6-phosphate aminotransferase [isomerizing] n=1 Tax=Desulfonatronum thiosulfatophilum TaxID=617002 RepID=A0A1G6CSU7_9BACT|nr:glutamine--fructose-6-phosphate transaminase (isomerizing) [Desulfonatronum thiosulfatophilum]SDB35961.1 glucosamine--fructose-6-phosphate aminotransferase (isomerizing) [Desulfonatronum thiosulfatophilum]